MKVYVTARGLGKTHAVLEWLMDGEPTLQYPGWSRVVVCPNNAQVVHLTKRLRKLVELRHPEPWPRHVYDLLKAVWSANDFRYNHRGAVTGAFEVAIDNADEVLRMWLNWAVEPTFVTMTGEPYEAPQASDTSPGE